MFGLFIIELEFFPGMLDTFLWDSARFLIMDGAWAFILTLVSAVLTRSRTFKCFSTILGSRCCYRFCATQGLAYL